MGDIISGNFQNKGAWYPGRIVKVLARKGYYNVKYDDGDRESNVPTARLALVRSPPRKTPSCARPAKTKAQAQSAKHRSPGAATTARRSSARAEGQERGERERVMRVEMCVGVH